MAKNTRRSYNATLYNGILCNMMFSLFRWEGLPDSIDPRIPETLLHKHGNCCLVQLPADADGEAKWVCGTMVSQAMLDFNGNPTKVIVTGRNGKTLGKFAYDEVIPIYNNYTRSPDVQIIDDFAARLGILTTAIDNNVLMRRFPGVIRAPATQLNSVKNMINQFLGDSPFMVAKDKMGDAIDYIDFGIPATAMDNDVLKRRTWNEIMVFMGIDASPAEKSAQVGSSEVYASMGMTYQCRKAMELPRLDACKLAQERGLDLNVKFVGQEVMRMFAEDKAPELTENGGNDNEL